MRWQDATQAFDEVVGHRLNLNGHELRCLASVIEGPCTAGTLAQLTGLTPSAITSLVDRLERRGYLARKRSEEDRRKVMIEATPAAHDIAGRYYGPIAADGAKMLAAMEKDQLEAALAFMEAALALQERHLARLQDETDGRAD